MEGGWRDNTIRLWDANTGEHRHTLEGHVDSVNSLAYSPDGGTLASGSGDGTVLLWELTLPVGTVNLLAANVNRDGTVNTRDLEMVASHFGQSDQDAADVNQDGIVNVFDLVLVAATLGAGN